MSHMARAFLLVSSCAAVACGGQSASPGTDARTDGAPTTEVETFPLAVTLELDRTLVDLGRVVLGNTATATLTMTNRGATPSGIPTVSTDFDIMYPTGNVNRPTTTGCDSALPPGGSCALTIGFTPTVLGRFRIRVEIAADPGAPSTYFPYVVATLDGTAIGFELSPPGNIELGDVMLGVPIRRSFTVTASIDLTDLRPFVSSEDLSLVASASSCTAVLPKGASCEVAVDFQASTIGWKETRLSMIAGKEPGQSEAIHFSANVSRSNHLLITPDSATLPCIGGERGPPLAFTVTNVGTTASGPITATVIGDISGDLVVSRTDCAALAPQAGCTVEVVCDCTTASAAYPRGILTVTDGSAHLSVPLAVTFAGP